MSISIEELHIGSHVLFNGERVEIRAIDDNDCVASIICDKGYVQAPELHPIPITEELLTELPNCRVEKYSWTETIICYWKAKDDFECCVEIYNGYCAVSLMKKDCEGKNIVIAEMRLRYLHELEAFVYLTTKQRLI